MRRVDVFFAVLGVAIGGFLTVYAYYSNSHSAAARISETVYLTLFPPSIGLMATENAATLGQVVIVSILVSLNGVLYGCVSALVGTLFGKRNRNQ
jgi:hypothetical protein